PHDRTETPWLRESDQPLVALAAQARLVLQRGLDDAVGRGPQVVNAPVQRHWGGNRGRPDHVPRRGAAYQTRSALLAGERKPAPARRLGAAARGFLLHRRVLIVERAR